MEENMKAVALISDGIDSPVAAYMMLKKGVEVTLLNCGGHEKNLEKVKKQARLLSKFGKVSLLWVDFNIAWKEISEKLERHYTCLFCKRFMYRVAEAIAKEEAADFILTGENVGQVASQTLQNILVNNSAIKTLVVRPLIAMDKEDTIKIAKEIGTYDISILPAVACEYVPHKPSTEARLEKIEAEEKKIDVSNLLKQLLKTKKEIKY
jgi:thiamine biosynthesis protein ThiI